MTAVNKYELRFEKRPDYLLAEVESGQMNETTAREYLGKIAAKCSETGAEAVLIIRDVPVMLADGDLFDITNYFLSLIGDRNVAFVNPHAEISEDMEFAIRIGTNRGGMYHLFSTVEEAERWIHASSKRIEPAKNLSELS